MRPPAGRWRRWPDADRLRVRDPGVPVFGRKGASVHVQEIVRTLSAHAEVLLFAGHRFDATQALRQVLRRAVEWEWLSDNPAECVPNPQQRSKEKRSLESWEEVGAVAAELRPVYEATAIFAAATRLGPPSSSGSSGAGRSSGRRCVRAARIRERAGQAAQDPSE